MDRKTRAAARLFGSIGEHGELHASPLFVNELAAKCDGKLPLRTPAVSKWSYGEQLEHLYRGSLYVLDRLEDSMAGNNPAGAMGFWGYGLMVGGFIPRGFFPTIPQLVPQGGTMDVIAPLRETLERRLSAIPWDWNEIRESHGKSLHPRMKYLTASEWVYFADIHHRHHLAIMRDIAGA